MQHAKNSFDNGKYLLLIRTGSYKKFSWKFIGPNCMKIKYAMNRGAIIAGALMAQKEKDCRDIL